MGGVFCQSDDSLNGLVVGKNDELKKKRFQDWWFIHWFMTIWPQIYVNIISMASKRLKQHVLFKPKDMEKANF